MRTFSLAEAIDLAAQLGIDIQNTGYSAEEFLAGLHVELEHGSIDLHTDVTNDDPLTTAKIVLAHLNENHMYYDANIGVEAWEHALDKFKGDTSGKKIQIV
jgi:hypothetical protein